MQYTPVVREIRWTEWSEEHIAEHEVSAAEVEEVVYQKPYLERREGQEVLVYGQTDSGRYLLVVLAPDTEPQETSFVVTARELTSKEKAAYRKKVKG